MQNELLTTLETRIENVREQLEEAAKDKKLAFDQLYNRLLQVRSTKQQIETEFNAIKVHEQQLRSSLEQYSAQAASAKTKVLSSRQEFNTATSSNLQHNRSKDDPTQQQDQRSSQSPSKSNSISNSKSSERSHLVPSLNSTTQQVICTGVCLKRGTYLQHKWRARWVELTTTTLRYFCSEFDSVRRDAWPRDSIQIKDLIDVRLGDIKTITNPVTKKKETLQTFVVQGIRQNNKNKKVEFILAAKDASAIRWVTRIHRLMHRRNVTNNTTTTKSKKSTTTTTNATTTATASATNTMHTESMECNTTIETVQEFAQSIALAEEQLLAAREHRDTCQETLLNVLQHREEIASTMRDVQGIEQALLEPLLLQSRFKLAPLSNATSKKTTDGLHLESKSTASHSSHSLHSSHSSRLRSQSQQHHHINKNKNVRNNNKMNQSMSSSSSIMVRNIFRMATDFSNHRPPSSTSSVSKEKASVASNYLGSGSGSSTGSSTNGKYISNCAVWEEGTSFALGQEPKKNSIDAKSLTVKKLNNAIRALLTLSMDASDTEEDRNCLRHVLNMDVQKKRLWRVLERLVIERERTKRRLCNLTQRSDRFEETTGTVAKRENSVGPLFEVSLD